MSSYIIENGQVVIRAKTEVFVQRDPTVFIKGDPGPPGPPGPPGDGSAFYKHTQNTPSATWTIIHNLNFEPQTQVFSSGGVIGLMLSLREKSRLLLLRKTLMI